MPAAFALILTLAAPLEASSYEAELAALDQFRAQLAAALESGDAEAVLPLVSLPLRINLGHDGSITLNDDRFPATFRPLPHAGMAQAHGRHRANRHPPHQHHAGERRSLGSRGAQRGSADLQAVVVSTLGTSRDFSGGAVQFICETEIARYAVFRHADEVELQISSREKRATKQTWTDGKDESGGMGDCRMSAWVFEHEGRRNDIGEPGCREDEPPRFARGTVRESSTTDRSVEATERWCY